MSATNPAPYPGNPSLPREVRDKILSTFRHTLNLFGQGKLDDCVIGCDFILKMDPRFAPARRLMDKARNPAADVDVSELESLVATTPTRQERVVAADPDRLLVRAVESFNARDFDAAIAAANQVLAVLPGNQDAMEIRDQANAKKAAQPVFDASRQRALAALEGRRDEEASAELEKMRQLDPDHPAVALLERRLQQSSRVTPPPPSPAPPVAPPPPPQSPPPGGDLDGLSLDFPASPSVPSSDGPAVAAFDAGATVNLHLDSPASAPPPAPEPPGGAEGLSFDSLSLDVPAPSPQVVPPPPDLYGRGPLEERPEERPQRDPGAPPDLWTEPPPTASGWSEPESSPQIDLPPPEASAVQSPLPRIPEIPVAAAEPDAESSDREIAALLRQGDEAARKGDRQQAIEIWSRIFLIDINNSEAVGRIEKARQEMAEGNRVVSEGLKSGRQSFEAGDFAKAREAFLRVLAIDENEATARFYLDRIEEELARAPAAEGEAGTKAPLPGISEFPAPVPPAAAAAPRPAAARKAIRINPRVAALVAAFVVLSVAGVFFVRTLKPGAAARKKPSTASAPAPAPASLEHARQLAAAGKTGEARAELRRIPPSSPDYAAARTLIGDLGRGNGPGTSGGAPAAAAGAGNAPAPGVALAPGATGATAPSNEAAQFRSAAEKALSEKRYIDALKNFHLAAPSYKDDPTFSQAMGTAADKVTTLTPAVKLYNEGEYETAIPVLWRITQDDRTNQDARSYLLRAYFNQGITQLQNGLYAKAAQSFGEALALDPTDAEAIRHKKFAERYAKSDLDLMGRIYVRHVNRRP